VSSYAKGWGEEVESSIILYLPELISISLVAVFMAISPGADFAMVTRNSIIYGRRAGVYSSIGIALAIWIHVIYSIAGVAVVIANSLILFNIIKYCGAAYLIYMGVKSWLTSAKTSLSFDKPDSALSGFMALKLGFVTNALNPKTTLFFLSIFTQIVDPMTPIWMQLIYGLSISVAHFVWFSLVSLFFSHSALQEKFDRQKSKIEKIVGGVLILFGVRVIFT
jgi:RhtB (resistance to homoserine/threonine) family protein